MDAMAYLIGITTSIFIALVGGLLRMATWRKGVDMTLDDHEKRVVKIEDSADAHEKRIQHIEDVPVIRGAINGRAHL